VELLITIAVLAILTAIAFPSFKNTMQSNRVATTTNEVLASLSYARSEAIRSSRFASVCASKTGTACDGNSMSDGWLVWADTNGDGTLGGSETVLRFSKGNPRMQASLSGGTTVTFDARGRRRSTSNQAFVLRPTDCETGQALQRQVTVGATGQAKVAKESCA
jgi:type IV fimbrial biogenesis protein FimT